MKLEIIVLLAIYASFALLEAWRTGFFRKEGATKDDAVVEGTSAILLLLVIQPGVLLASATLASVIAPGYENALAGLPYLAGFVIILLCDDLVNYWYHRSAHTFPTFYNLHRPHHNGEYMSVRVVFRNGLFYYLLSPYYWLGGILLFMGLGWVYVGYTILKGLITFACHSDICWDKPLYANKWTSPIMWVVERLIVTPSFHHAHHGRHKADGVTHYKGNFGNLSSFWDVIFGTAHITRKFPDEYGVEDMPDISAGQQLLWPIIKGASPANASNPKPANGDI